MAKRLIDADALMKRMEERLSDLHTEYGSYDSYASGFEAGMRAVEDAETVDAVVLLCKVGELVYALWSVPTNCKYIIYCAEVKEIRIAMRNCRVTTTYSLEPIEYRGRRNEYRDADFGNLVFLTREEAEAALAKMDGGKEK